MANRRLSMRKIKEVLRLTHDGKLSERQVAQSLNLSRSTVKEYRVRAQRAGLSWPLPETLNEEALEQKLFPPASSVEPPVKALPDFEYIYRELKAHRKFNLTLDLLWQEYKEQHPEGYQYSQFCGLYRRYRAKLDYCMRQDHRGGEKLFVDYGEGLSLIDAQTHEPIKTQLFVAVWGASNYTYAEATLTQQLPDWIGSHVRAFSYFGGVPKIVVPDCLKSAVSRACRYEPELNPTYADMASHYGICILPARPARPRDKAKVENGVLIAKRWILAVLRHRTFYYSGRDEWRHRRTPRAFKPPTAAQAPTIPSPALFALRSTQRSVIARQTLRVRRVESRHRQHRLPHRSRQALLQRAVSPAARKTRCAPDRPYRGSLPKRPARGHPRPKFPSPSSHHPQRAYAGGAPELSRMDALTNHQLGRKDRPADRAAWSKRLSTPEPIPSTPIAPAWESCAWRNITPKSVWRTAVCEPFASALCRSKPCATSWRTAWIAWKTIPTAHSLLFPITKTSAAAATTTEKGKLERQSKKTTLWMSL